MCWLGAPGCQCPSAHAPRLPPPLAAIDHLAAALRNAPFVGHGLARLLQAAPPPGFAALQSREEADHFIPVVCRALRAVAVLPHLVAEDRDMLLADYGPGTMVR